MKRFTDTEKFSDPWFRQLTPEEKCFWDYICSSCDNAGVWKVDMELAAFSIGAKLDAARILESFTGRIKDIGHGKWFVVKFIQFQFPQLKVGMPMHKHIQALLVLHGISDCCHIPKGMGIDTPPIPTPEGIHTLKDKVLDKDKERKGVQGEGKPQVIAEHLQTLRFAQRWSAWMDHRRTFKPPKDWRAMFQEQLDWLATFTEHQAHEVLSYSMRNGYQGLIEPSRNGRAPPSSSSVNGSETASATWAKSKRVEALTECIKDIEKRGFEDAMGLNIRDKDKPEYKRLIQERKKLQKEIAG